MNSIETKTRLRDIQKQISRDRKERFCQLEKAELMLARLLTTKRTLTKVIDAVGNDMLEAHRLTVPNLNDVETVMFDTLEVLIADQQAEITRLRADQYRSSAVEIRHQLRAQP
jgi:hypothetical protein